GGPGRPTHPSPSTPRCAGRRRARPAAASSVAPQARPRSPGAGRSFVPSLREHSGNGTTVVILIAAERPQIIERQPQRRPQRATVGEEQPHISISIFNSPMLPIKLPRLDGLEVERRALGAPTHARANAKAASRL